MEGMAADGTDIHDPAAIQTPEMIDRRLVRFGILAAREAENMTEEDTAEYFTHFLRVIVEQITGVHINTNTNFQFPPEIN